MRSKSESKSKSKKYDSNFWLCTATIDPEVKAVGQENAYKEVIKTAVGGAAGVIRTVESAVTDCQPNENVEALRVFMLGKKVECRPVWKPMHRQPVYQAGEVSRSKIQVSSSKFQVPGSKFQVPGSKFQVPSSKFQVPSNGQTPETWNLEHGTNVVDVIEYGNSCVYTKHVEEDLFKVGFCLPAGPYVTDDDVRYIVECIKEAIVQVR